MGGSGSAPRRRAGRVRRFATATLVFVAVCAVSGAAGAGLAAALVNPAIGAPHAAPTEGTAAAETPTPSAPPASTPTPTPAAPAPEPTEPSVAVSPADTACATATTTSVWAHYDDDLIFLNPTLMAAFEAGDCVRSVFVTDSAAGRGLAYTKSRELGILRSYNAMRGQDGFWSENRVTLLSGLTVSQWSPQNDPDVTVTFLRFADGGLDGGGYGSTGWVSLPKLVAGTIPSMTTVDGASTVTAESLTASLGELIRAYHTDRLFTHVPATASEWSAGDHPDHSTVGTLARAAWQAEGFPADRVQYVLGYPSAAQPVNVEGAALARKLAVFRVYAAQDPVVSCKTDAACLGLNKFGAWLQRSYLKTDAELFPAG